MFLSANPLRSLLAHQALRTAFGCHLQKFNTSISNMSSQADNVAPVGGPTKAWLLVVSSVFQSLEDRDALISHVEKVAHVSARSEPATLGFQVAISDSNPLQVLIFERFASKKDWAGPHRDSAAYKELKSWQAASGIQVQTTGHSYVETGIGYLTPAERSYVKQHADASA